MGGKKRKEKDLLGYSLDVDRVLHNNKVQQPPTWGYQIDGATEKEKIKQTQNPKRANSALPAETDGSKTKQNPCDDPRPEGTKPRGNT